MRTPARCQDGRVAKAKQSKRDRSAHCRAPDGRAGRRPEPPRAAERPPRGRSGDPFTGELRRREVLPLLVLHLIAASASYGNQLMERIGAMTEGVLSVNPNTMYPLLRQLEQRGLIEGKWEHPERRSRRFYSLTPAGRKEYERLRRGGAPVPRPGGAQHRRDRAGGLRLMARAAEPAIVALDPERGRSRCGRTSSAGRCSSRVLRAWPSRRASGRTRTPRSSGTPIPEGRGKVTEKRPILR